MLPRDLPEMSSVGRELSKRATRLSGCNGFPSQGLLVLSMARTNQLNTIIVVLPGSRSDLP